MSNDSLARIENKQPVSRVVVLRLLSFSAEVLYCQDLSHAYVIVFLPLVEVVDFRLINAYPLEAAHVLIAMTSSSQDQNRILEGGSHQAMR